MEFQQPCREIIAAVILLHMPDMLNPHTGFQISLSPSFELPLDTLDKLLSFGKAHLNEHEVRLS